MLNKKNMIITQQLFTSISSLSLDSESFQFDSSYQTITNPKSRSFFTLFLPDCLINCVLFHLEHKMNYIPLESTRAKWASFSFGMDDKYDQLIRKTTTFLLLLGTIQ